MGQWQVDQTGADIEREHTTMRRQQRTRRAGRHPQQARGRPVEHVAHHRAPAALAGVARRHTGATTDVLRRHNGAITNVLRRHNGATTGVLHDTLARTTGAILELRGGLARHQAHDIADAVAGVTT